MSLQKTYVGILERNGFSVDKSGRSRKYVVMKPVRRTERLAKRYLDLYGESVRVFLGSAGAIRVSRTGPVNQSVPSSHLKRFMTVAT